ncbi:MAG: c-type cytochrome, partial [Pseudomonadota bacterium]
GTLDGIEYTLRHGIRHDADLDTRFSLMPAFGRDSLLSSDQIDGLTHYVLRLSGQGADAALADGVADLYQQQCATCHGVNGEGDRLQGAPNLTDREWLYGNTEAAIYNTIYNARNSHMPAWQDRLDDASIKALAVYVHTLGGGE